jgi:hypothetical protein
MPNPNSDAARPWFKFYPSNWRGSQSLKLVSMAARGLWIEMLCIMHEAEPCGHLVRNGRALTPLQLASMVGAQLQDVETWLSEMEDAGVFRRKKSGVIYSVKMEKDENRRRIGRETGLRGGNPKLRNDSENELPLNGTPYTTRALRGQRPEDRKKETPIGAKKGSRLSSDWRPTDTDMDYALGKGLSQARVDLIGEKFCNYWTAKSGAQATKIDWPATWRNWVLTEIEHSPEIATPVSAGTIIGASGERRQDWI